MQRVLGRVLVHMSTSVKERRARKMYIGLCKASSVWMRYMRPKFPVMAMLYMVHRGKEIHKCTPFSAGMPFKMNEDGVRLVPFRNDITTVGISWYTCYTIALKAEKKK